MKQFLILPFFVVSVMAQVTLDVKVLPRGADVFLDGKKIGSAPVKGYYCLLYTSDAADE